MGSSGTGTPRLSHAGLRVLKAFLEDLTVSLPGAEIIRQTGLASGTLYPILLRFERNGLLDSQWEDASPSVLGRPRRRHYSLTGHGQTVARQALRQVSFSAMHPVLVQ